MAFNHSRSVGEEEEAEVEGTYRIRFLLSFFCLSFVFLYSFPFVFPLSFLDYRTVVSLFYYVWMPVPLSLYFFCCVWPTLLRKVQKRRRWFSCGGALLDRVCLSLERGLASVYSGPGECSVEVCLVSWPV